MPFTFTPLEIDGLVLIGMKQYSDARGSFMETYKRSEFALHNIQETFVQDNHSRSSRGALRGLHYQLPPYGHGKLIRVISGEIFDVAVDLRPDSSTRWRSVTVTLSAQIPQMLFVPPWCAHGFCVLSDAADVLYKTTTEYAPEHEGGIMWNDPALAIDWPVPTPILSERDQKWPPLR